MENQKKIAAIHALDFVKEGMTIGIGTGTTVSWFIRELGERVRQGLRIKAVPTSLETAELATDSGIPLLDLNEAGRISLTIDGADEIDPKGQLIKGGGGALLQEKIVAAASNELIIIADSTKLVQQLGKFPLPIEIIPFGYKKVQEKILGLGSCKKLSLRKKNGEIFVTDHHHYILDCECEGITDASHLNISLHLIPGVVETGLFVNMADKSIIGYEDGRVEVISYGKI